jgi:hypothetical protein
LDTQTIESLADKSSLTPSTTRLDREVQDYLTRRAAQHGVKLSELVNELLRKDIDLIETGK